LRLIEPPRPGLRRYLGDVWRHRPAFSYFVRQYIGKRTSRTFFGGLWLLIPLVLPLVMGALVFGGILTVKTGPIPYLLYLTVAMLILLAWACALGVSPLAPRARDVRRLAGYFLSFWYFLTPVIYPIDKIPSDWQFLASLNPVTAPIELVKDGLLGVGDVTSLGLATYFGALVVV